MGKPKPIKEMPNIITPNLKNPRWRKRRGARPPRYDLKVTEVASVESIVAYIEKHSGQWEFGLPGVHPDANPNSYRTLSEAKLAALATLCLRWQALVPHINRLAAELPVMPTKILEALGDTVDR